MDILSIIGIGIIGAVLTVILRQYRPELAMLSATATAIVILMQVVDALSSAIGYMLDLSNRYGIDTNYIGTVIRIIGIAYICQFASEVCRDSGETAVATKIEFGGKVLILLYALPVVESLLSMVVSILP